MNLLTKKTLGITLTLFGITAFAMYMGLFAPESWEFITSLEEEYKEEPRPKEIKPREGAFHPDNLDAQKRADYDAWKVKLAANGYNFNSLRHRDEVSYKKVTNSFANGKITGEWEQKYFKGGNGFRVDGSAYDPVNDQIYGISYAGHLYKLDKTSQKKWERLNHKEKFLKRQLTGINLADGKFRMLKQEHNGGMQYSDDEGKTWTTANGALFENGWNSKIEIAKIGDAKKIIAHGGNYHGSKGYHHIYFSSDYGLNYTESAHNWAMSEYDLKICKPFNSSTVYAFARKKSSKLISIYKMKPQESDFSLVSETSQSFNALSRLYGTYHGNSYHFYVNDGAKKILYSSDAGKTWTVTNEDNDKALVGVHPTKPNICYKGFVELKMSEDYGTTFTKNKHKLNKYYTWDLQHFKFYEKEDGSSFAFAGLDFGCYYSDAPENWDSWQSLNLGSPIMMCYDAFTSEKHNAGYVALQDRGCRGYVDQMNDAGMYSTPEIGSTDVLRVTTAKNGESVWFWYYYGAIGRSDVTASASKSNVKKKYFYSKWWASSMVGSPDPNEDAVYISTGTQLQKIYYDGSAIKRTMHPHVFPSPVSAFGYSKINTNRWYVSLKSGQFYYSTDGGNTFEEATTSGNWPGNEDSYKRTKQVIKTSPVDEQTVYYAGKGNLFLISTDGGQTFTEHNSGLKTWRFRDFDVSDDGKFIFGACANAGAWVFSVEDDQWYKMDTEDVPNADFTAVQYLASKNTVRFATYGSGIIDLKIGSANDNANDGDVIDDKTTSATSIGVNKLRIYPNPAKDILYFEGTKDAVKIFTLSGQHIDVDIQKKSINISKLSPGAYILKAAGGESVKFIKN